MNIKSEIVRIRKMSGLSQEAFGEMLGVSRQSVTKWENGDSLPEIEKLLQISLTFNISLDALIKGPSACSPPASRTEEPDNVIVGFLCRAKRGTYAGKGPEQKPCRKESHDLRFDEGNLDYLDSYFGGRQFIGEEVLWKSGSPFWAMNYMGRVLDDSFSGDFLKECLLAVPEDMPYRGPELYTGGDYIYRNKVAGSFSWFSGEEDIYYRGKKVYECLYHGGIIL